MSGPCLQLFNVACGYAGRVVLADVSAEVARGQIVGLLGANGSGKSTLLRTAAGLIPPRTGAVQLLEHDVTTYTPRELATVRAYMPQSTPIEEGWCVADIVAMGRFPHVSAWRWGSMPDEAVIVEQALQRAGIWEQRAVPMNALSGGQRQRVHLARALAQQGQVLLLDEPTAHLDLNFQLVFYRLLQELAHRDGVSIVVAVHDLNLAAQFCDQLWVLGRPRENAIATLLAAGKPVDVLQPALLARAFGLVAQVHCDSVTNLPYVVPRGLARREAGETQRMPSPGHPSHIHVMGGGGSAEQILRRLAEQGCRLSIGVVNLLDSDLVVASQLGVDVLLEAPFSPVGPDARAALWQMLLRADVVVVADVPWGVGNVENLRTLVKRMAQPDPPRVLLLGYETLDDRDFTQEIGRAHV